MDKFDHMPLPYASGSDRINVFEILIQCDVDVNVKTGAIF
jgi:hypothetical protein